LVSTFTGVLELELAFALAYAALLHEEVVNVQQIALQKAEFLNIMRCSLRRNFSKRAFWVDVFVQRSRTSRKAGLPARDEAPVWGSLFCCKDSTGRRQSSNLFSHPDSGRGEFSLRRKELVVREKGTVKWFNGAKGYGFIQRSTGEDVFVHFSAIQENGYRTLNEGETVEFELLKGPKGYLAANVLRAAGVAN
jgi:cold shock protein